MRIAVAGTGRLAAAIMEPLLASGHQIVGLIQNARQVPPSKRRWFLAQHFLAPPAFDATSMALRRRIPIRWIDRMDDSDLAPIRALDPDIVLTAGFSIIFNDTLLDLPTIGCVNVHSSLLPEHRGACPFAHAILANDKQTGVTYHAMTRDIDAGAILAQAEFPITPIDTSITIYYKCCNLAGDMALNVIDDIELHGLAGEPQDSAAGSYDPRITEDAAAIDWTQSAEAIERLIRGTLAYFPAWFTHRGRVVRVTRATFDPRPVIAPPGTVLETRPYPVIATGEGRLIIHAAHSARPVPWSWPAPWTPLRMAEALGTE